ncbi:MAG: hypothetical protein U5L06_01030 [Rhodovibrio sp.]|nr:hypothetical protein [Rhodovibrio sp.]
MVCERAWQAMFARNMFIRPPARRPARLQAGLHGAARAGLRSRPGSRRRSRSGTVICRRASPDAWCSIGGTRIRRRDQEVDLLAC